jgi:hypothetical protein
MYNGYKKVDRVYQVELEILYSVLPSPLNNSQNSIQGSIRNAAISIVGKVSPSCFYSCEWAKCWL